MASPILVILLLHKSNDTTLIQPSKPWIDARLLSAREITSSLDRPRQLIASILLFCEKNTATELLKHGGWGVDRDALTKLYPQGTNWFAFLTGRSVLLKNRIFSLKIEHEGRDKVTKYVNSLSNATLAILCISLSLQPHAIHSYAASMISTRGICRDFACCSLAHLSKPPPEPARKNSHLNAMRNN